MKPNLLKNSNSQTAVLEKDVKENKKEQKHQTEKTQEKKQEKKQENIIAPKEKLEKKQEDLKKEHLENKKSLFNAFSANFEQRQEKQAYIKQETQGETKQETLEEETENEELIADSLVDFKTKIKPKKKTSGFRFKLVTIVYALVLGVTVGWVGANAFRVAEVQKMIHAQDLKYVQKIAELDKLKESGHENDQLIPWDQILPVQSLPLEDVTDYEIESNWFDNIINWFGKLFGG